MRGEYWLGDTHFWRAHYCACVALIHNRYKMKNITKNKKKKLGLGGAAAGGVPRAADGEGAGRNLVRPKLAAR